MNRVQLKFIEDAIGLESRLTDWERTFIDDLDNKPDEYELSARQNETLNRISQKLIRGY